MTGTLLSALPITEATREIYFGVGGEQSVMKVGMYPFLLLALAYLGYSLYAKIQVWRRGKPELRTDQPFRRIGAVIKYALFQAKVLRESVAGIMHTAIFWGFAGLVLTTAIITIQQDITSTLFGIRFLKGHAYLLWSLLGDVSGFIVLVGLVIAVVRRYIVRPERLDTEIGDTVTLLLLTLVVLTGFFAEAMRIALTGFPHFEVWSPFGFVLAYPFSYIPEPVLGMLQVANWWVHFLGAFLFIALMGTGKIGHIFVSTLNIYFGNLENERAWTKYTVPVIDPASFETAESFGVANVTDFTWKQLLAADACTRCGRCQDNCPAHLTGKPLSPKKILGGIRISLHEEQDLGTAVSPDEYWSCTNCSSCMEQCPVNIEQVPAIIEMRRAKVLMEGAMAPELQTTFVNMENNYNPYGFAFGERGAWLPADSGVTTLAENPRVDFLFFAGCAASYDKRNQKVAIALLAILKKAGYRVGILGAEEVCCGDAAMRGGNEYLFQSLAAANLATFARYGVKRIITACPHCYNVLNKEYRKFARLGSGPDGARLDNEYEVYHHTEILADIVSRRKIDLVEPLHEKITYHDSCFLGRYNEIYAEPRDLIRAVPGTQLVEMERNHGKSFCCGAGGARMFIEEHLGTRINQARTGEARETGASKICTACPFCMTMLGDGALELGLEGVETLDIAEIVYAAMEK